MLPSEFGTYRLDISALGDVPLTLGGAAGQECRLSLGPSTFGAAYLGLRNEKLLAESRISFPPDKLLDPLTAEVTTSCCKHAVAGPSWALDLIITLLGLTRRGIEPFAAAWFPYAQSACIEEPRTSVKYFLVHNHTIVDERVSLFASPNDGVRYLVAETYSGPPVWTDEREETEGAIRAWYSQFYETTHAGRTILLRRDAPPLYGLERPSTTAASVTDVATPFDQLLPTLLERLDTLEHGIHGLRYIMLAIAAIVTIMVLRKC
jgi:hypothetical protein